MQNKGSPFIQVQQPFVGVTVTRCLRSNIRHQTILGVVRSQSRADQIEVSLNEDIKSKEERKMKQRQVQNTTLCVPRPHRQAPSSPVFVTLSLCSVVSSFPRLFAY